MDRWLGPCLLLLLPFCSEIAASSAEPAKMEEALVQLIVNTKDEGDAIVLIPDQQTDVLLPIELQQRIGLIQGLEQTEINGKQCLSIASLGSKARFKIEKGSILFLTLDPSLFQAKVLNLGYQQPSNIVEASAHSAFLNYSLAANLSDSKVQWKSTEELGINIAGMLGLTSFAYDANGFVRLNTSITRDRVKDHTRFILGDFSAFTGLLGSTGQFGGFSFSSNYSSTPYFAVTSGLDFRSTVATPSEVEIYVNGQLIKKEHLDPGEFQFSNFRAFTGAGEAVLIIRDAFGREQRFEIPFYLSSSLLKPRLAEFSYNIGWKRAQQSFKSFDYDELSVLGFHRFGITKQLTAGFRFEADRDILNAGPSATFSITHAGQFTAAAALSRQNRETGYAGILEYAYFGRGFSIQTSGLFHSRNYATLMSDGQNQLKAQIREGFGQHWKKLGSINVSFAQQINYQAGRTDAASVSYSKPLNRKLSLTITATGTTGSESNRTIFASLNFYPGGAASANLTYQQDPSQNTITGTLQRNAPRGEGIGYRFLGQATRGGENSAQLRSNAFLQYKGPYGNYSAEYLKADRSLYEFKMAGGIGWINSSLFFSRPIDDSFGVVEVGDLDNVRVLNSNAIVGKTQNGRLFVPDLTSYLPNRLSISAQDLPGNYSITETSKNVATGLRGGGIFRFDVKKIQGVDGHLSYISHGKQKTVELAKLEVIMQERTIESAVGKGGEFYLENLPPGKYAARAIFEPGACYFNFVVPQSQEPIIDLGNLICELR